MARVGRGSGQPFQRSLTSSSSTLTTNSHSPTPQSARPTPFKTRNNNAENANSNANANANVENVSEVNKLDVLQKQVQQTMGKMMSRLQSSENENCKLENVVTDLGEARGRAEAENKGLREEIRRLEDEVQGLKGENETQMIFIREMEKFDMEENKKMEKVGYEARIIELEGKVEEVENENIIVAHDLKRVSEEKARMSVSVSEGGIGIGFSQTTAYNNLHIGFQAREQSLLAILEEKEHRIRVLESVKDGSVEQIKYIAKNLCDLMVAIENEEIGGGLAGGEGQEQEQEGEGEGHGEFNTAGLGVHDVVLEEAEEEEEEEGGEEEEEEGDETSEDSGFGERNLERE